MKTYRHSQVTKDLVDVAMGRKYADLVITNTTLVNTATRELIKNVDIAVTKGRIALVGDGKHTIGKDTKIIDGTGYYTSPGFMDGHIHVESSMMTLREYAKLVVPLGTTAIFHDPHEIGNVLGTSGIDLMITDGKDVPLRCFATMPSCVPAVEEFEIPAKIISPDEIKSYLNKESICGLGEMMNIPGVLSSDENIHKELSDTLKSGKVITGHYTMPSLGKELNAYISGGARCCHESVAKDEALEKMRHGMYVQIREGSAWQDLTTLAPCIVDNDIDSRFATLVSDDTHPNTLREKGHIDHIIRLAIKSGIKPIEAIQMATINTANCFEMGGDLGSITPGKLADIVMFHSLEDIKVDYVVINGELVAEKGKLLNPIPEGKYPDYALNTIKLTHEFKAEDFIIYAPEDKESFATNVIEIIEVKAPNRKKVCTLKNSDGQVKVDLDQDIIKVASIERHHGQGEKTVGFVKGFGLKKGAIASTVSHDAHNIIVVGASEEDMSVAVNEILKLGGGIVAVEDGKPIAKLPLQLAGLMSISPSEVIDGQVTEIEKAWEILGSNIQSPFMTMALLSLAVIPELRITNKGLVDTLEYKFIPLFVQE